MNISITNSLLNDIKKSADKGGWDSIARYSPTPQGSDAPKTLSADFCMSLIKEVKEIQSDNEEVIYRKIKTKEGAEFWNDINANVIINPILSIYKKTLEQIVFKNKPKSKTLNVEKAKQFPITSLLTFNRRLAKCIFHNEKNASLYYYPETNTCYCFSCNTSADSIDIYKKLNNCSFVEAVKALQ